MGESGGGPHRVLSVVGAGRSGTTVLASILGEVAGVASAGELRFLWGRGVQEGRPCGCGDPPAECPVWAPVVAETVDHLRSRRPAAGLDDLVDAQRAVARPRSFPRLLRTVGPADAGPSTWPELDLVRDTTATAVRALARVTGASVVVDTSKRPVDAAVMASTPDLDVRVVHLVRDPRAVVHSWRRAKSFTAGGQTRTMGTRGMAGTVRRWSANAMFAEGLRRRMGPERWLSLRYEDFAAHPRTSVESILDFLDIAAPSPFRDDRTALLHPNHIVAGNPSRFTTGEVTIRADDAWQREMPIRDQRLVASLTWPLLLRHGYRVGTPGDRRAAPR